MVGRGDLSFDVGSRQWWGPGMLYFCKVLSFAEVKASVCEQQNLYTGIILCILPFTSLRSSTVCYEFCYNVMVIVLNSVFHVVNRSG
jgi:hypothetical protein